MLIGQKVAPLIRSIMGWGIKRNSSSVLEIVYISRLTIVNSMWCAFKWYWLELNGYFSVISVQFFSDKHKNLIRSSTREWMRWRSVDSQYVCNLCSLCILRNFFWVVWERMGSPPHNPGTSIFFVKLYNWYSSGIPKVYTNLIMTTNN